MGAKSKEQIDREKNGETVCVFDGPAVLTKAVAIC